MFSLNNLPANGVVRVYVTCERWTPEAVEHGDADERGWVNAIGSRDIYESRNDVSPVFEASVVDGGWLRVAGDTWNTDAGDADTEALEELRGVVNSLGAYHSDNGSTLYAEDGAENYETGEHFMYAIHAHVKHYTGNKGWQESDVDILQNRL